MGRERCPDCGAIGVVEADRCRRLPVKGVRFGHGAPPQTPPPAKSRTPR